MGKIKLEYFTSISYATTGSKKDDPKPAEGYKSTQGYTVGPNNSQVAISLKTNNNGCFLKFKSNGAYETAKVGVDFGHGNGCTYYDGYYYVALGGGGIESPVIKRYDKNFNFDRQYKCLGDNDQPMNVYAITHMSNDYFILEGNKAYVCKKYDAAAGEAYYGGFVRYSEFTLDNNAIKDAFLNEKLTRVPQSIYYDKNDKMLYKVVSYKDNEEVTKKNGIAKFSLSGNAPSYSTATFEQLYTVGRNDISFFELESMSSDSNGRKYVAANARYIKNKEKQTEADCDAIFKIELQ